MAELRVFHATDLSAESEPAFAHAVRIAACAGSSLRNLTVLHVGGLNEDLQWEAFPSAQSLMRRWAVVTQDDDVEVDMQRVQALSSDVLRAILQFVEDASPDLIVLATHGRKGWDAWFHGSVAEPVARLSHAMTLFVRHECQSFVSLEDGTVNLDEVLVPVVIEPAAEPALRAARRLCTGLGAPHARLTACFVGDPASAPLVPDEVPLVFRSGAVAEQIVAVAKERQSKLIVMTTEGRHGILDAFRGSTTEQVLRLAPCPVLAVPAS
jgi:nucleotide-binding universal stress UspA family protein